MRWSSGECGEGAGEVPRENDRKIYLLRVAPCTSIEGYI